MVDEPGNEAWIPIAAAKAFGELLGVANVPVDPWLVPTEKAGVELTGVKLVPVPLALVLDVDAGV